MRGRDHQVRHRRVPAYGHRLGAERDLHARVVPAHPPQQGARRRRGGWTLALRGPRSARTAAGAIAGQHLLHPRAALGGERQAGGDQAEEPHHRQGRRQEGTLPPQPGEGPGPALD